jgi:hypothetical protein
VRELPISHREPRLTEILDRLMARYRMDEATGCWVWQGRVAADGYALVTIGTQHWRGHQASHTVFKGPVPPGLQIDHLCHNRDTACAGGETCLHRRCVNPEHLEAVTGRTNTLRSVNTIAGINARRTECKWGHPFDDINTYLRTDSRGRVHRQCKACGRGQGGGELPGSDRPQDGLRPPPPSAHPCGEARGAG